MATSGCEEIEHSVLIVGRVMDGMYWGIFHGSCGSRIFFFERGWEVGDKSNRGSFHSTGAPKCQKGATFFSEGGRHILGIVCIPIILTESTAGSERAPQGFMVSMQPTTIYCCVGGLCGAPLHESWVLAVLQRAL